MSGLGVDVRELDRGRDDVSVTAATGLVDLEALAPASVTLDAARRRAEDVLVLARSVDARSEPMAVVAVTSIDGRHGFGGGGIAEDAAVQATGIGFWKCVAKEWRHHAVRCLDVAPGLDADVVARHILGDLSRTVGGHDLEHGLDTEGRWRIEVRPQTAAEQRPLRPDAVVLALGAAQGIGSDILERVVAGAGRTVVIAGRTDPTSVEESDEIAAAHTAAELRAVLIELARREGRRPVPREIDVTLRRISSARRVRATVERLAAAGTTVEYRALDARDADAVKALVDETLESHGRLDLVVHAAGVLSDSPVGRKTAESMEPVLSTKIVPALALSEVVPADTPIIFFGSVAGRFGNAGQADYAAANEFLAKLAARRRREGADLRCIAWGPWDSGMVSPGLLAAYDALGITPIAAGPGADAFAREVASTGTAEVVLANDTDVIAGLRWPPTAASILGS